jgi:hypothetical protein
MRASAPIFVPLAFIEHAKPTVYTICRPDVSGSLGVGITVRSSHRVIRQENQPSYIRVHTNAHRFWPGQISHQLLQGMTRVDPRSRSPRGVTVSYSTFAKASLARRWKYLAPRLDRLPYLRKSGAFALRAFGFCANFFWLWSFHKIHLLK